MGRKGKTQKHTAKEIAGKHKAAKERNGAAGHGGEGQKKRAEAMGKVKVKCRICLMEQPHIAGMRIHYESKHPKETWTEDLYAEDFGKVKAEIAAKKGNAKKDGEKLITAGTSVKKPSKAKNDLSMLDGY